MSKETPNVIPVQYIPYCEDNSTDLKDIIKTFITYKKFIFVFTLFITLLGVIYVLLKKPVYEIQADLKVGHINITTDNGISKLYLLNPNSTIIYIKNTYDNSKNDKIAYPQVETNLIKGSSDIINIKILHLSNNEALSTLETIINDLKKQEKRKTDSYIKNIESQIQLLQKQKTSLLKQLNNLKTKLNTNQQYYQATLEAIQKIHNDILKITLQINTLKEKISPINFSKTHIIGKVLKYNEPVKPKKKLIIIIALIVGFIISLFLVLLIDFIKGLNKE